MVSWRSDTSGNYQLDGAWPLVASFYLVAGGSVELLDGWLYFQDPSVDLGRQHESTRMGVGGIVLRTRRCY